MHLCHNQRRFCRVPYILAYKPTIFGRILTMKLCGVGLYMGDATQPYFNSQSQHSMDHQQAIRPLCRCRSICGGRWDHTDFCCGCGCIPVKSSTVTSHHSNTHTMQDHCLAKPHTSCLVPHCHMHACCSHCCELVDAHASLTHRSRVLVSRHFCYTRLIFAIFSASGMGSVYTWNSLYVSIYGKFKHHHYYLEHLNLKCGDQQCSAIAEHNMA